MNKKRKIRFALIGAGWRAMYYVRIAEALPELFECAGILCRSAEKAERTERNTGVRAVLYEQDVISLNPDFIVVAVSKDRLAEVSLAWLAHGFPVLCETPGSLDLEWLKQLWQAGRQGKLVTAEQYLRYPEHSARITLLENGLIGDRQYAYLSAAHGYHGMSLIRGYLHLPSDMPYTITAQTVKLPTVRTLTRYEAFHDGSIADTERTLAMIRFDNGAAALYDFDSEQYRSSIRNNLIKVQGTSGELINDTLYRLSDDCRPEQDSLHTETVIAETGDPNPNLSTIREISRITWKGEEIYRPPFGLCRLGQDETAIASLLYDMGAYARDEGEAPYALKDSMQDAVMAIDLAEAVRRNEPVRFDEHVPWFE